jgi:hypothetical protein
MLNLDWEYLTHINLFEHEKTDKENNTAIQPPVKEKWLLTDCPQEALKTVNPLG